MKVVHFMLVALALYARTASGQDDEDYGGMDDYGDEDGGGGGYGEDEDHGGGGGGGGPVEELTTVEDFEAWIDNNDASVIGAFTAKEIIDPEAQMPDGWDEEEDGQWQAPTIENPALTAFNSVTSAAYGYRFAITFEPAVLEKLKSKKGGLYLYRSPRFVSAEHGDRARERFPSDKLASDAVINWLAAKAQPLVGMYSSQTQDRYKGAVLVLFMNLDFDKNAKGVKYVLKRARKAAAALKGKLAVAVAHASDMSYEIGAFGLESKSSSDILMGIKHNSQYYPAKGTAFTAASLSSFADEFLAGKLEPFEDPEPEVDPHTDDAGADDADDVEHDEP